MTEVLLSRLYVCVGTRPDVAGAAVLALGPGVTAAAAAAAAGSPGMSPGATPPCVTVGERGM